MNITSWHIFAQARFRPICSCETSAEYFNRNLSDINGDVQAKLEKLKNHGANIKSF